MVEGSVRRFLDVNSCKVAGPAPFYRTEFNKDAYNCLACEARGAAAVLASAAGILTKERCNDYG
jgi:hypothetical protein